MEEKINKTGKEYELVKDISKLATGRSSSLNLSYLKGEIEKIVNESNPILVTDIPTFMKKLGYVGKRSNLVSRINTTSENNNIQIKAVRQPNGLAILPFKRE